MERTVTPLFSQQRGLTGANIFVGSAYFIFFLGLALLLNYRGLQAPMYYDSVVWIQQKRHLFAAGDLWSIINIFPQRPLTMLSFYVNYLIGDMNPASFRVANLAILSMTAVVVTFLVNLLLSLAHERSSRLVGLMAGLFFLVHPLQTYVTLYIWQRSALMACFFYYAALLVYLGVRTGRFRFPLLGHFLCLSLFVLAMLSKENAITLPVILLLVGIAFFSDTWKEVVAHGAIYSAVVVACAALLSLVERAHGSAAFSPGILNTLARYYQESELSFGQALLTQSRVIFHYVAAILFPTPATVQLVAPQMMSRSLLVPPATIAAVGGAIGLAATSIWLLKKRPLAAFGVLFFIINLLPESVLVPQYQFFGYRAVLPMLGIILVAADLAAGASQVARSDRLRGAIASGLLAATTVLVLIAGYLTMEKANLWTDPVRFWTDAVDRFSERGNDREARPQFQALHNLGTALQARGAYEQSIPPLQRALHLAPGEVPTVTALAYSYAETDRLSDAEQLLKGALALDQSHVRTYRVLGHLLAKEHRYDEAHLVFKKALALAPEDDDLYDGLARLFLTQGKVAEGEACLRRALALNPRSYISLSNLGAALLLQDKVDEAINHLEESLRIRPDYWGAHENLGAAFGVAGKPEQAVEHLKKAVQLNPRSLSAKQNLDTALRHLAESRK